MLNLIANRLGGKNRYRNRPNRVQLAVESLEERLTPAVSATFDSISGVLRVEGTSGNDQIRVSTVPGGANQISVMSNGDEIWTSLNEWGGYNGLRVEQVRVYGNAGNDNLSGAFCRVPLYLHGEEGNDTLAGGILGDTLHGGSGNDMMLGGSGSDYMSGASGNDSLYASMGDDTLYGGLGADYIDGGFDNDQIDGGDGHAGDSGDTIWGDRGNDTIHGNAGDDQIYGNDGDDIIYGDSGADYIEGNAGLNTLFASKDGTRDKGKDRIHVYDDGTTDLVFLYSGGLVNEDKVTYQVTSRSHDEIAHLVYTDNIQSELASRLFDTYQVGVSFEAGWGEGAGWSQGLVFSLKGGQLVTHRYVSTFTSEGLINSASAGIFIAKYYYGPDAVAGRSYSLHIGAEIIISVGYDVILDADGDIIGTSVTGGFGLGIPFEATLITADTVLFEISSPVPGGNFTSHGTGGNEQLFSPAGETADATPTFNWVGSQDAVGYELWVNNVTTGEGGIIHKTDLARAYWTPGEALPVGDYRAWTRPIYAGAQPGDWSEAHDFTVTNLLTPVIDGPGNETTDTTPTVSWQEVEDAESYEVWLGDGKGKVIHETGVTDAYFVPTSPLAQGKYRVWVRAHNAEGQASKWSARRDFTINAVLTPVIGSPTGETTDKTPTIQWQTIADADTYEVWVNNRTTGQNKVIHENGLADAVFTPAADLASGNYRVWVRAHKDSGEASKWSKAHEFTVVDVLTPDVVTLAVDETETRPVIAWATEAAKFELWVSNVITGQSAVIHETELTKQNFRPDHLPTGVYKVWVRGFDADGNAGKWSKAHRFSVVAPAAPILTGPIGNTDRYPTFMWNAAQGATRYELWVSSSAGKVIHLTDLHDTTYTATEELTAGDDYRVWVRAFNALGEAGAWSNSLDFSVVGYQFWI